ncbi:MAG: phosphate ABC transporter substrate-binding/OmpA family protein [gamma proteobacterium endosymbiont of Lamellibrachia anaximandri]|nr:phosphate ABC transporter substrate-binding/OmpA family protein [gamma proteobacterium endosymbiont of Lamellibrachia anaximandri]
MRFRLLVLLILVFSLFNAEAESLSLRIHGSNTVGAQLAPELARAWLKTNGYQSIRISQREEESIVQAEASNGDSIRIEIIAKGSSTGFKGLKGGQADLAMSSRRIKEKEIQELAPLGNMTALENEHVIALDGIAVIVHPENPLSTLKKSQIRDIFAGKITDWKTLGRAPGAIHLYARDDQSGTFDVFRSLVLRKKTPLSKKAKRFVDNTDLSNSVAMDKEGIGFVGLPHILQSKALAISDGEAPAIEPKNFSVATEDYALSRRLYLYLPNPDDVNSLAQQFSEYARSDAAQEVIEKVGFVSQRVFASTFELGKQYPEGLRKLAQGTKRLSVNMRFSESTVFLDNKARRDADRIYRYLDDRNKLKSGILLFGFTEKKPDGIPMVNYNRSVRRADQVGKYLREKGVWVVTSRGYGNAVPVASNESELGQAKNRRVELWLK